MYSFSTNREVYNYIRSKFPSYDIVFFDKNKDYIKKAGKRSKKELFRIKKENILWEDDFINVKIFKSDIEQRIQVYENKDKNTILYRYEEIIF